MDLISKSTNSDAIIFIFEAFFNAFLSKPYAFRYPRSSGGGFSLIVLGFFIAYNFVITIFLLTFAG